MSARRGGGRDQACERKVTYSDRPSAATAMSGMASRIPHWHVGHKPRRRGGHP